MKAIVIAGLHSGAGKTTVATGLMAALRRRGLRVQPYKVGPDYIDPSYHTAVCGTPSRNLDRWLLPLPTVRTLFTRSAAQAGVCVIEGVMGLFDGRSGEGELASTAEMAKALDAPVLLVVDVAKMARTAGALVLGVRTFDPNLRILGVICNNVASPGHLEAVRPGIEQGAGVPVLGALQRNGALTLPERYLGLIPMAEGPAASAYFERLSEAIEASLDLDRLLELLPDYVPPTAEASALFPVSEPVVRARIAIARDAAFHFYYEDGLDLLRAWGGELLPFSPLTDEQLPAGTQGVYIGGGFPELYAQELAANSPLRRALRSAAAAGLPIYGECGGAMYLGQALIDRAGARHEMAGLTPMVSAFTSTRLTLGYRTVTARRTTALVQAGEELPGHEFHLSAGEGLQERDAAYTLAGQPPCWEGFAHGSVLASYVHLHFASNPCLAPRFVAACARHRAPA